MNNTVQDLKMEMEPIKKTQMERILEKENLGRQTRTSSSSDCMSWKRESQALII